MNERIANSDYQQLQYFISESPWAYPPVIPKVGEVWAKCPRRCQKAGKGRKNSNYVSNCISLKVKTIKEQLTDFQ